MNTASISSRSSALLGASGPAPTAPIAPPPEPTPATPPTPADGVQRGTVSPGLARYLQAAAPAAPAKPADRTAEIAARNEQYFTAAGHAYTTPEGKVTVPPQFRMVDGHNQENVAVGQRALQDRLGSKPGQIPLSVAGHVFAGRGSPAEVARVTQALVDAGRLPPADSQHPTLESRLSKMMWDHGVGIDCAGYVQQALAHAHGKTAAQIGLRGRLDEDLGSLANNPHFTRVALADLRAGDVITLRDNDPGQPGHTVLVAAHQTIQGSERAAQFASFGPAGASFAAAARLEVYTVDSSWGAGTQGLHGGLERKTWFHDPATDLWLVLGEKGTRPQHVGHEPYPKHSFAGNFRVKP